MKIHKFKCNGNDHNLPIYQAYNTLINYDDWIKSGLDTSDFKHVITKDDYLDYIQDKSDYGIDYDGLSDKYYKLKEAFNLLLNGDLDYITLLIPAPDWFEDDGW